MSGCTGADRIRSREDYNTFFNSYSNIINQFDGFVGMVSSGSFNSDHSKTSFGDIDVIVWLDSSESKSDVKKNLVKFFSSLPDSIIVPFSSIKYNGKKCINTGEIVTIRYYDENLGYSVQIDNIIALSRDEMIFKSSFLDMTAEKQGLILGLVKVAAIENDISYLFNRLRIKAPLQLPINEEYEFNLSSIELQLRRVVYEPDSNYKQKSRSVIWSSQIFGDVMILLHQYDLSKSFVELLGDVNLSNTRSPRRISGVFSSMITVKSGEVGTPKAKSKEDALKLINQKFDF